MFWIVFVAQYYTMIGAQVDEEKPTSTDACPAYINTTLIATTQMYVAFVVIWYKLFLLHIFLGPFQPIYLVHRSSYIGYLVIIMQSWEQLSP